MIPARPLYQGVRDLDFFVQIPRAAFVRHEAAMEV
jgi:hypothetical protein